ncbi:MAG TPA: hypothetical protein VNJ02_03745 [Vicinamibacterales bacterium]|nr:hypothetical protein [Vicinamibacterales bacterium]
MARVRLIHWNGPDGRERKLRLASLGHHAEFTDLEGPALLRTLRTDPPEAFVIDLSRLPAHGRDVGLALRAYKDTRHIPIVFVDGDPAKVAKLKMVLPDAVYTSWPRIKTALPKAIARPVQNPTRPPAHAPSTKATVEKLGVKAQMRVGVLNGPSDIAMILAPLPDGVTLTAVASQACDLFLAFVHSARDLHARLAGLSRIADRQTAWLIWPKKASGITSDLSDRVVRESGLAAGWVDYKVCSVSPTWSGLAFKRRR